MISSIFFFYLSVWRQTRQSGIRIAGIPFINSVTLVTHSSCLSHGYMDLRAGPTPSTSLAARRWGRSFRSQEDRAPRFSPGLLYRAGSGGRFPRASPPLRSPDAQLSARAPNFPITLPLPRDWGGWGAAGIKARIIQVRG